MAIELMTCGACGAKNASSRNVCLSCGVELRDPRENPFQEERKTEPPKEPIQKRILGLVKNLTLEQATKVSLIVVALLVSFSAFYYFVIFLPKKERETIVFVPQKEDSAVKELRERQEAVIKELLERQEVARGNWILWIVMTELGSRSEQGWAHLGVFSSREACEQEADRQRKEFAPMSKIKRRDGSLVFTHVTCYPSDFDPRPRS